MPLVKASCTNCGGILQVDKDRDAAICPFCKTPYVVEKAIMQFVTKNTNYIQNATFADPDPAREVLIRRGIVQLELKEVGSAAETFEKMTKTYPEDHRGWLGLWLAGMAAPKAEEDFSEDYPFEGEGPLKEETAAEDDPAWKHALELAPPDVRQRLYADGRCELRSEETIARLEKETEGIERDLSDGMSVTEILGIIVCVIPLPLTFFLFFSGHYILGALSCLITIPTVIRLILLPFIFRRQTRLKEERLAVYKAELGREREKRALQDYLDILKESVSEPA
ncbi:MAG: hypothetical protein IK115_07345 [Lachnospiraceae bacterium]|nr:hypothetical protein [Lachnospiraceae bacterium]